MAKSKEYWRKRFEQLEDAQMNKGAAYFAELEKQYTKAARAVQKDIDTWFNRFATNNEITLQEARKLLSGNELEEFRWNVMEYGEKGRTLNYSNQWAKQLENASAKFHISRLEALKLQMQNHVEALYGEEHDDLAKLLEKIYTEGYYHTAYEIQKGFNIGYSLMKLDANKVEKLLSKPWAADGSNFSDRIWKQKSQLVSELHNNLTQAIIRGQNPSVVTDVIAKRFNVSKGQAGRLVMTEAAFFHSASTKDCYKDFGVEQYEVLATLDKKTSDVCRALDGKVFRMSEYEVGVTAPPFHTWCRTTTVPYFNDEFELGSERAARDDDGKTYYVPASMKYDAWYKKYVDKSSGSAKFTLKSPVRPKRADYEDEDVYYADRDQYKVDRAEFERMLQEYVDNYHNSIEVRFSNYDEFKDYLQQNGFIQQTVDLLEQDGGIDSKAMTEFADAYELTVSKLPKLKDKMAYVELDATKATSADAWTFERGDIVLGKGYVQGAFKDHIYSIGDAIGKNHYVGMNTPSYHDFIHEIGHNAEAMISEIVGGSQGKIAGNGILWNEIANEFNITTADELLSKYPVSIYGTDDIHEWFAETFTGYIDGSESVEAYSKLGKILEKYLR